MAFRHRELSSLAILTLVTFGIYGIIWTVETKDELNRLGADIPSAFLMIIPIAHFYFWYRYAIGYAKVVLKSENDTDVLVYFLLSSFMPFISMLMFQRGYNKMSGQY